MSNALRLRHLVIGSLAVAAPAACGGKSPTPAQPVAQATAPLPTGGLAGQRVSLFPLTLIAAEDSLHWEAYLADRRAALERADSVVTGLLMARAPEVSWIAPDELRRAARRSAGVAPDPGQLATAVLRAERLVDVPDPLRSQLRVLVAMAGGRYAVIPAALVYRRAVAVAGSPPGEPALAELSVVVVDVRLGRVQWRTVARGRGGDPWAALTQAMKGLTPGLP